jgi:hypothetical protein
MPARSQGSSIAPQVAAAACWWGDYLRSGQQAQGDGDDTLTTMSEVGGRLPPLPAERIDAFEAALAELLQREYRDRGGCVGMVLSYWPHPLLEQAAERAGIDLNHPAPTGPGRTPCSDPTRPRALGPGRIPPDPSVQRGSPASRSRLRPGGVMGTARRTPRGKGALPC